MDPISRSLILLSRSSPLRVSVRWDAGRRSRVLSLPQRCDYALKGVSFPIGGVARSTMQWSPIVWAWER